MCMKSQICPWSMCFSLAKFFFFLFIFFSDWPKVNNMSNLSLFAALLLLLLLPLAANASTAAAGSTPACASSRGTVALFNLSQAVANAAPADYYETVQLVAALGGIVNRNTSQLYVYLTDADSTWWPFVQSHVSCPFAHLHRSLRSPLFTCTLHTFLSCIPTRNIHSIRMSSLCCNGIVLFKISPL